MQEKLWIFSVSYSSKESCDFARRAVVGPAGSLTVETALHLAGVPEAGRLKIRADSRIRRFVDGSLDFEGRGYYVESPVLMTASCKATEVSFWTVGIGPVHMVLSDAFQKVLP